MSYNTKNKIMTEAEMNQFEKKFTRTPENFTCLICGQSINGTGYTDHCPNCLWSLHVDINPGDRKSSCQGLMEPIGVIQGKGSWRILYKCQSCSYTHFNKSAVDDNIDVIIQLSSKPISESPKSISKGSKK